MADNKGDAGAAGAGRTGLGFIGALVYYIGTANGSGTASGACSSPSSGRRSSSTGDGQAEHPVTSRRGDRLRPSPAAALGVVEPRHRMHARVRRLPALLRRAFRRTLAGHRRPPLRARLRPAAAAGPADAAVALEEAAAGVRDLDERPLPRADPGRLRARRVRRDGAGALARLSRAHQARAAHARSRTLAAVAAQRAHGRDDRERQTTRRGRTRCAPCPPPSDTSAPSRCSARSTARSHRHRLRRRRR